jgi:DNA-binding transcriptional ArsR family regulator
MKHAHALVALAALAHEHRLRLYRLLVRRGSAGLPAGELAERLGIAPSSLSFHVQQLRRAGLVNQRRAGRLVHYAADFAVMRGLVDYLSAHCCEDSGELCASGPIAQRARRVA